MFKLTCGDSWVDELPSTDEGGSTNIGVAFFIMSYIVIAVWTVLQVCMLTDRVLFTCTMICNVILVVRKCK